MEQDIQVFKKQIQNELESRYSFIPKEYVSDAVGEAYSEYLRSAPKVVQDNERKTISWLRTTAKRRLSRLYPHSSISIEKEDFDIADNREDIEELFATRNSIEVALNTLSIILRQTIELHYLHGMTHEEIGNYLNVKVETIKKRSQRGLEVLKEMMARKNI